MVALTQICYLLFNDDVINGGMQDVRHVKLSNIMEKPIG
jgi:hypothetical protein